MKLLQFKATWCNPCKNLTRTLENINIPYDIQLIDIEEDIDTAIKFNVRSVPTLILLDSNNNIIQSHVGSISESDFIKTFLNFEGE